VDLIRRVLSDSIYTAARIGLTSVRAIVIIPLITKLLGPNQYGVWVSVLAIVGLMSTVGGCHMHGAFIRFDNDIGSEQTYTDILSLSAILAAILSAGALVLAYYVDITSLLGEQYGANYNLVILTLLITVSKILLTVNKTFPRARGNVSLYEYLNAVTLVSETIGLITIFALGGSVVDGLWMLFAVSATANVGIFVYISVRYSLPAPSVRNYAEYLRYGLPMLPKEMSGSLISHADKYIILYFLSPAEVGIYAVAYNVSKTFKKMTNVLNPSLYPRVSSAWDENEYEQITSLYSGIFRYYSVIAIPMVFGLSYLSQPILELLATSEIASSGSVLVPILTVGFLFKGYENVISYVLTSAKKTRMISFSVIVTSIANVVLNIFFVSMLGVDGAAVATSFSFLLLLALIHSFAKKQVTLHFPYRVIVKCSVSAYVMIAAIYLIPFAGNNISELIITILIGVCTYTGLSLLTGVVTGREVKLFYNWIVA